MNFSLLALALHQAESDNSMWIILAVILVVLFFVVLIIVIALVIFLVMRKRKKAQQMTAGPAVAEVNEAPYSSDFPQDASGFPQAAIETSPTFEPPPPAMDLPSEETRWPSAPDMAAVAAPEPEEEFDPSRTVAIVREPTVVINYGKIKFVSGVLAGEEFPVEPDGSYIGREPSLARIVVSDPRISKRHLWIGVRDGAVTIIDQESRNGTFINDPRSERVHEARLNQGDTVIMGESDVARFEYHQD